MDPLCEDVARVSYTNFGVSLFILLGILVSYLPQHVRIIRLRSSYGLSPYFVLLGTTSGTCAFANILVLPKSRQDIACCREVDQFACLAGLMGVAQVGVQWSCFGVILLLFLIFFPRNATPSSLSDDADSDTAAKEALAPSYRVALLVTAIAVVHAAFTFMVSFYVISLRQEYAQSWANFLGISSTVLASIQYLPQIYTTYTLKRVGSLSIPMMCIQTPGSFVWAGSLAARLGKEGWSAWGVYSVTGCLQGTLLVMGVYFEVMHRRREKGELRRRMEYNPSVEVVGVNERPSEETPLLRSED